MIVPCYNVEPWVERCIISLLAQTWRELEIVAVNDRSTDGTAAILNRLAKDQPRLRVLHLPVNVGLHAARCAGFMASTGTLVGFVDADDHVEQDMYRHLAEALLRTGADIALTGHRTVREDGTMQHEHHYAHEQVMADHLLERFARGEFGSGVIWNKLYRKDNIADGMSLTLNRAYDSGADYIVGVGCFADARKVVVVPGIPYHYELRHGSMSLANTGAAAFVFLLECHVACLKAYTRREERVLQAVDLLYARQLRFKNYSVADPQLLQPFRGRAAAVLQDLARLRPQALYALIHTFDPTLDPPPPQKLRYHLGQVRRSLGSAVKALFHGRA